MPLGRVFEAFVGEVMQRALGKRTAGTAGLGSCHLVAVRRGVTRTEGVVLAARPRQVNHIQQQAQSAGRGEKPWSSQQGNQRHRKHRGEHYLHRGCGVGSNQHPSCRLDHPEQQGLNESRPEGAPGEVQDYFVQIGTAHTGILALEPPQRAKGAVGRGKTAAMRREADR